MAKLIKSVTVNWFYGREGEEYQKISICDDNVESFEYHEPRGSGDRHYVDVRYKNGQSERVFNLNTIEWESKLEKAEKVGG